MTTSHRFAAALHWRGEVRDYDRYAREFVVEIAGKPALRGSAAPAFRGDAALHNPEDLLVASLAACHFLSYAALCARHRIVLLAYDDAADGVMAFDRARGVMAFERVTLHPDCVVAPGTDLAAATALHDRAHRACFIASSVNFPVEHAPRITAATP